jgi:hypothetical protein
MRCTLVQWNLTNPNSLGPELVQIGQILRLVKQYIILNWGLFCSIYCTPKCQLFGLTRVRINSIQINECLLYREKMQVQSLHSEVEREAG